MAQNKKFNNHQKENEDGDTLLITLLKRHDVGEIQKAVTSIKYPSTIYHFDALMPYLQNNKLYSFSNTLWWLFTITYSTAFVVLNLGMIYYFNVVIQDKSKKTSLGYVLFELFMLAVFGIVVNIFNILFTQTTKKMRFLTRKRRGINKIVEALLKVIKFHKAHLSDPEGYIDNSIHLESRKALKNADEYSKVVLERLYYEKLDAEEVVAKLFFSIHRGDKLYLIIGKLYFQEFCVFVAALIVSYGYIFAMLYYFAPTYGSAN